MSLELEGLFEFNEDEINEGVKCNYRHSMFGILKSQLGFQNTNLGCQKHENSAVTDDSLTEDVVNILTDMVLKAALNVVTCVDLI